MRDKAVYIKYLHIKDFPMGVSTEDPLWEIRVTARFLQILRPYCTAGLFSYN